MANERRPDQTLVVYDGHCGFCSRVADWLRSRDRHRRLALLPAQTPGLLAGIGLAPAEAAEAAWAITPDGRRWRGAGAMLVALEVLSGHRLPLSACYRLPGFSHASDAVYRLVAANRHLLPGTPDCSVRPPSPTESTDRRE